MAEFHDDLSGKIERFIAAQPLFFVATAPKAGRINLSPKGLDCFRVLTPHKVGYLDLTGSGNETAAHLLDDGRITFMFCSFGRTPQILRLYGRGRAAHPESDEFRAHIGEFPPLPGIRQIIVADIESIYTSCGFGVPEMTLKRPRPTLEKWEKSQGEQKLKEYRREWNVESIDGLPTGLYDIVE